jgi:transposase
MKRYEEDFKIDAVKQITEKGYKPSDVAKRLGVNVATLKSWVKKIAPNKTNQKEQDAQSEIKRLKKALARAEEEREILKKAAAYFARESS